MSLISPLVASFERISARSRILFHAYAAPYRRLVARELRLARVQPGETIMHIGCGSLPFTALLAATLSGCRVIGVDCDPSAARNAHSHVARGSSSVEIIEANGADARLPSADVVLVALQAAPKPAIYEQLCRSMPDHARLVFRLPRPVLESEYGTLEPSVAPRAAMCRHAMPTFDRSVLYRVKQHRRRRQYRQRPPFLPGAAKATIT